MIIGNCGGWTSDSCLGMRIMRVDVYVARNNRGELIEKGSSTRGFIDGVFDA